MSYTITIFDEDKENLEDIIDIVQQKVGFRIPQKNLIPLLTKNPKAAAEIILQNIKESV